MENAGRGIWSHAASPTNCRHAAVDDDNNTASGPSLGIFHRRDRTLSAGLDLLPRRVAHGSVTRDSWRPSSGEIPPSPPSGASGRLAPRRTSLSRFLREPWRWRRLPSFNRISQPWTVRSSVAGPRPSVRVRWDARWSAQTRSPTPRRFRANRTRKQRWWSWSTRLGESFDTRSDAVPVLAQCAGGLKSRP